MLKQRYTKKKQSFKKLMPSRKAQGVRFSLPLAPFPTAHEITSCGKSQHPNVFALFVWECGVLPSRQSSSAGAAEFVF